jgi:undecaprenyl-diphosphatase
MSAVPAVLPRPAPALVPECLHSRPPLTPATFYRTRRPLLVAIGALLTFLAIAAASASASVLLVWDLPIQRAVESSRTGTLSVFFRNVSLLASTTGVLVLAPVLFAIAWKRCQAVAVAVAAAALARPLLEFILKELVGRDRPDLGRLVNGTGYSFPSGHVMAAVALWGLLPVVVGLYTRRRAIWWSSVAFAATITVLVAASRVYLGVHWFSDVVAGLLLGSFFLLGVEAVLRAMHSWRGCGLHATAGGTNSPPAAPSALRS